jgi:hypothetical protein
MRTSGRRRFDAFVLGLGALAAGGVTAIGGVTGDVERVTGMWVGAALDGQGGAAVVEVIDYDFGLAQGKHGIFRTIPGLGTDDRVKVSSASAPDGIADRTPDFSGDEPGVKLKIGDPNTTITGRHRYKIEYGHRGLIDATDHLAWDAVGTGWTVDVGQSEVHVVAPWQFEDVGCSSGRTGARGGCELTQPEPGHLVATVGKLQSGEGITIQASRGADLAAAPGLPAPPVSAPPDPGAGLALPAAVASVASLGAAATASKLVRRRGRERVGTGGVAEAAWAGSGGGPGSEVLMDQEELATMATTEFAPPEGITAPMGGIILTERVQPEHKVAWLLEAAIAGDVELVEEGKRTVRLVRRASTNPATQGILDQAFAGRDEIELGSYDPSFSSAWASLDGVLSAWQQRSGLWDLEADRRKTVTRGLGFLGAILGLVGAGAGGALAARFGEEWLPVVVVAALIGGMGFAAAVRGWELKVRTPAGSGWWLRVESFRRFMAGSEAFHAEEAAKRGMLREYTAWAVAIGEIDRWERAVAASSAIPQEAGLGYVHMAPMLAASAASASTAPSSSGSGGGGGGSVGGGGGGGGGGSW